MPWLIAWLQAHAAELLLAGLIATQLGDWYSTRTILARGGRELNPLMRRAMELAGTDAALGGKTVLVSLLGWWIGTQLEFLLAGANAVSVGTVVFHDPSAPMRIHQELQRALGERGFSRLSDAVSYAHRPADVATEEELDELDIITE